MAAPLNTVYLEVTSEMTAAGLACQALSQTLYIARVTRGLRLTTLVGLTKAPPPRQGLPSYPAPCKRIAGQGCGPVW